MEFMFCNVEACSYFRSRRLCESTVQLSEFESVLTRAEATRTKVAAKETDNGDMNE
jgi:hypothetical protein